MTLDTPALLRKAVRPEDIFGNLPDGSIDGRMQAVHQLFRQYASAIHPDRNPGLVDASALMAKLTASRDEAEQLLVDGRYGKDRSLIRSAISAYHILSPLYADDVSDVHLARTDAARHVQIHVLREPTMADLFDHDLAQLARLFSYSDAAAKNFQRYLLREEDRFFFDEGKQRRHVAVYPDLPEYYRVDEVRSQYPDGITIQNVAWMLRRILEFLAWAHRLGLVHGGVTPHHVLVGKKDHGAKLTGWMYSHEFKNRLRALSSTHADWYPPEVKKRIALGPSLDVHMAIQTAVHLVSDRGGSIRRDVPREVVTFFDRCRTKKRPAEAWAAYLEFSQILESLFGKPRYQPFVMPDRI